LTTGVIYSLLNHIIIRRKGIFCLYLFILLAWVLTNPNNVVLAQVHQNDSHKQYNKTKYYACNKDEATPKLDCFPSTDNIESYATIGSSTQLYNATNTKPSFTEGKQGKALEVNAKYSESVILSQHLKLNPSEFSVSFWIKPSSQYHGLGDIISYSCIECFPPSGWYFELVREVNESNQSVRFGVYNSTGGLRTAGDVIVPSNVYTHLVGIFDGSNIRIFRNGILAVETAFDGIYNNTNTIVRVGTNLHYTYPLKVGTASYCNACYLWSGLVDDLQIYNKALKIDEVKQIYSLSHLDNSNSSPMDLIGHWTFDGNLNDSTRTNSPGFVTTLIASMAFTPDGSLFFTEKNTGNIRIMKDNKVSDTPFLTINDHYVDAEQGLLGLTIDPKFKQNGFVYLYYTYLDKYSEKPFNRVVRFTDVNNTATNRVTILNNIPAVHGYHSGGALAFGPDDKLYVTVGDATNSIFAQNPSVLLGKILRINRDGTIPKDNPYPNSPVYNIGHRNMYGIAFNNAGLGLVTENGANLYDEINTIEKGGNYGYPTLQPPDISPELYNSSYGIKPLRSYKSVIAPTQAIFYTGDKIPELKNKFLFGSINGKIYSLDIVSDKKQIIEERIELRHFPFEGVIGLAQSPSGDLYFGGYSIYKLESIDPNIRKQSLFPIQINSSLNANIASIQSPTNDFNGSSSNEMIMTLDINKTNNSTSSPMHNFLNIRIPKTLMKSITSVVVLNNQSDDDNEKPVLFPNAGGEKELDFSTDDSRSGFAIVKIPLDHSSIKNSTKIMVTGESNSIA
jgi:glucose/arabinose dehydrogenase